MSEASLTSPPPRQRQFYLLFICLLVIGAGNSMLFAVAPPLVRQLNLSDSTVGWIFALSAVFWVFSSTYWGKVSDRVGRKPIVAVGLAGFAVSMALFAASVLLGLAGVLSGIALFAALIVGRCVFGVFGSATAPAAQAYIADRTSVSERTEQLAALNSSFAVGQAFGPALCAALAAWLGLVFPIGLVAVLAALSAYVIVRYLPENTPPKSERARNDWRESLALLRDQRLSGYLIYGFALSMISGITVQVFGLFTMDRLDASGGHGAELTAAGFMVNALALLATQLAVLPRLRIGTRPLMIWGAAIMALGMVIQIVAPSLGALLVSQAVQGLGFGLARSGYAGGASVAVRPHEQGAAAGLVVSVNGAGFVFSPLFGGVAYERIGMNAPLWLCVGFLIFMIVFAARSRRLRAAAIHDAPAPDQPPPQ